VKVLIAYDGSKEADAAIEGLKQAGLPKNTEAMILTVADFWLPPELPPGSEGSEPSAYENRIRQQGLYRVKLGQTAVAEADATASNCGTRVKEMFPAWMVRAEAMADSPAWGIIKKADEWKPNLIVLGARGHSALERVLLGSVSHNVLIHAPCSVRVHRPGSGRKDSPLHLIVGLDGSVGSEQALNEVAARSWPALTEVRVITASDGRLKTATPESVSSIRRWCEQAAENESADAWIHRMCQDAVARLQSVGLMAAYHVVEGNPISVLLAEAEQQDAHCIFVGARGMSAAGRLLLGSVSTGLASRAPCSVEVIRTLNS
jgi:nucleotide-binding universal stress UspA family protein